MSKKIMYFAPCEVICFEKGDEVATIAATSTKVIVGMGGACKCYDSIKKAISAVEAAGYTVRTDHFKMFD